MGISKLITYEFQKRFKAEVTTNPSQDIPLAKQITEANNVLLTREVTDEKIYDVVKHFHPLHASGPDGLQAVFYQKSWNIIGKSISDMVKSFFNSGHMLKKINKTYITLVPKIPNPDTVNYYRPIKSLWFDLQDYFKDFDKLT